MDSLKLYNSISKDCQANLIKSLNSLKKEKFNTVQYSQITKMPKNIKYQQLNVASNKNGLYFIYREKKNGKIKYYYIGRNIKENRLKERMKQHFRAGDTGGLLNKIATIALERKGIKNPDNAQINKEGERILDLFVKYDMKMSFQTLDLPMSKIAYLESFSIKLLRPKFNDEHK